VAGTISRHCSPYNVFLLFLYHWDVLFKNLNDGTLASSGNPRNMQIKAAITENLVFINISVIIHDIKIILVSIPIFCGVNNQHFSIDHTNILSSNMHNKARITENIVFDNISATTYGIKIISVSIPMFSGVKSQIKPFQFWANQFLLNIQN